MDNLFTMNFTTAQVNAISNTGLALVGDGVYELYLPGNDALQEGQIVQTIVVKDGKELDRIPLYANRVVQDWVSHQWNAAVHKMADFPWTDEHFKPEKKPFIYECFRVVFFTF